MLEMILHNFSMPLNNISGKQIYRKWICECSQPSTLNLWFSA